MSDPSRYYGSGSGYGATGSSSASGRSASDLYQYDRERAQAASSAQYQQQSASSATASSYQDASRYAAASASYADSSQKTAASLYDEDLKLRAAAAAAAAAAKAAAAPSSFQDPRQYAAASAAASSSFQDPRQYAAAAPSASSSYQDPRQYAAAATSSYEDARTKSASSIVSYDQLRTETRQAPAPPPISDHGDARYSDRYRSSRQDGYMSSEAEVRRSRDPEVPAAAAPPAAAAENAPELPGQYLKSLTDELKKYGLSVVPQQLQQQPQPSSSGSREASERRRRYDDDDYRRRSRSRSPGRSSRSRRSRSRSRSPDDRHYRSHRRRHSRSRSRSRSPSDHGRRRSKSPSYHHRKRRSSRSPPSSGRYEKRSYMDQPADAGAAYHSAGPPAQYQQPRPQESQYEYPSQKGPQYGGQYPQHSQQHSQQHPPQHPPQQQQQQQQQQQPEPAPYAPARPQKPSAPLDMGFKHGIIARITEYINDFSGIVSVLKDQNGEVLPEDQEVTVFFHACVVHVLAPKDRSGHAVNFVAVADKLQCSLPQMLPVGSVVKVVAQKMKLSCVKYQAVCLWPGFDAKRPASITAPDDLKLHVDAFNNSLDFDNLVWTTVHGHDSREFKEANAQAFVFEIRDGNYGVIKLIVAGDVFYCLFHKDSVYSKMNKGGRAVDLEYNRNKPLNNLVSVNQPVTLSARSITRFKGYNLKPTGGLDLQAVVVSLNVGFFPAACPRPTKFDISPDGAYLHSRLAADAYLEHGLGDRLNRELDQFFQSVGLAVPPEIHPECLPSQKQKNKDKKKVAKISRTLLPTMSDAPAVVAETVGDTMVVVVDAKAHWRALIVVARTLKTASSLKESLPVGTRVSVDAVVVDPNRPVQYVVSKIGLTASAKNLELELNRLLSSPEDRLLQYFNLLPPRRKTRFGDKPANNFDPESLPKTLDYYTGTVLCLLDSNYGLVDVHGQLVLFDACDYYIDPTTTVVEGATGLKLCNVVTAGREVKFHALLVDKGANIPYVATHVWPIANGQPWTVEFNPLPVGTGDNLRKEKFSNHQSMCKALAKPGVLRFNDRIHKGRVLVTFLDGLRVRAGIVRLSKNILCFFLQSHSTHPDCLFPGAKVRVRASPFVAPAGRPVLARSKINHFALQVLPKHRNPKQPEASLSNEEKSSRHLDVMTQMTKIIGSKQVAGLKDLHHPTVVQLDLNSRIMFERRAGTAPGQDPCFFGHLKCMINSTSGFLQHYRDKRQLCYFELDDLNVARGSLSPASLLALLQRDSGTMLTCQTQAMGKDPAWVAPQSKKVQRIYVLGEPRQHLQAKTLLPSEVINPKENRFNKAGYLARFEEAKDLYLKNKRLTIDEALSGIPAPVAAHAPVCPTRDVYNATGVVKTIINDSFALIQGPENDSPQHLCLFDTCDVDLGPGSTASSDSYTMSQLVAVGTSILYHACLIDPYSCVPYLATKVWSPKANVALEKPLHRLLVQDTKLDIYRKVVDVCQGEVDGLKTAKDPVYFDVRAMTATLRKGRHGCFGLVQLISSDRALLHTGRVWLGGGSKTTTTKDKAPAWSQFRHDCPTKLCVYARRVLGFDEFQYQVVFCHEDGDARHDGDMRDWVGSMNQSAKLDRELCQYSAECGS